MDSTDQEFFKELISMFKMESEEHLQTIENGLEQLEKASSSEEQMKVSEVVHRAAHSLKGAARTIGLTDLEPYCQSLEIIFSRLKQKPTELSSEYFEMLYRAVSSLGGLLSSMDGDGKISGDKSELARIVEELNQKMSLINN